MKLEIISVWTTPMKVAFVLAGIGIASSLMRGSFISLGPPVMLLIIPLIIKAVSGVVANGCELVLEEDSIVGARRKLLSTKGIKMPIEKLDNVFVSKGLLDLIRGGETVAIYSNSGVVKFPMVYNAAEFAQAAIKQIEKYKSSIHTAQTVVQYNSSASLSDKIAELQKLREQGILTDEQFEAKKQELISKF